MKKRTACPFGVVVLGHGGNYRTLDLAIVRQKTIETGLKQCRISRVGYCREAQHFDTSYQNGRKSQ